jgi:acyl carrier protein
MDRADALTALRTAAVEVLSVEESQVTEDASFADDLDADSLDLVELVMQLEDSLDVKIEEDDLSGVTTVRDAVDLIIASSAAAA